MKANTSPIRELFAIGESADESCHVEHLLKDRNVIVYGAGESFHYFKEVVMKRYGCRPSLVLDQRFKKDETFQEIRTCSADEYRPSRSDQEEGIVIVCAGRERVEEEIGEALKDKGFQHIIFLRQIYEIHNPFQLPSELSSCGSRYYIQRQSEIESGFELFEDELSRDIYRRCMKTHIQRKPVAIPMSDRHEQYTPSGIRLAQGYSRYLYCGVSVGEMTRVFGQIGKVDELVCFEPDPNQFAQTARYLSECHGRIAHRVTAMPCAVYSRDGVEPFVTSDTSFGSRILPSGNTHAQCVTIDHALPGFRPTFISMDIEGAELEALKGAEGTLKSVCPDLAVCVYHSPSHLWEIPLYLHGLGLGYRFYLRNYTSFVGETVLYAAA
jgi:FkbM family methyltransferase